MNHLMVEASGRARYRIDDSSEILTEKSSPVSPVFRSKNTAPIEITGSPGDYLANFFQIAETYLAW